MIGLSEVVAARNKVAMRGAAGTISMANRTIVRFATAVRPAFRQARGEGRRWRCTPCPDPIGTSTRGAGFRTHSRDR
jgi:hypothetical protein